MYTSLLEMLQNSPKIDTSRDPDDDNDQPTHGQPLVAKSKKVTQASTQNLVPDDYSPESHPNYRVSYKRLFEILNSPEYLKATTKVRFLSFNFVLFSLLTRVVRMLTFARL